VHTLDGFRAHLKGGGSGGEFVQKDQRIASQFLGAGLELLKIPSVVLHVYHSGRGLGSCFEWQGSE
jgi:hypothetical protein